MQFVSLTLQGFRSFRNQAVFSFGEPGLVQVLGVNELEPELDSNGAGKSTVFEAVQWVLFGRTSTNLRAGDVASWESDGKRCEVSLELEDDKHKYLVRRAWNPNELVLTVDAGTRSVDQETLERTLGYTPETFLYSVFHAQFLDNFATLTPARQLEIYTAALRLDTWEELSDKAAALAKPIKEDLSSKEKGIARQKGYLAAARESLEAEQEKELAWHRERWSDIVAINDELEELFHTEKELLADKKNMIEAEVDNAEVKELQKLVDCAEEQFQLVDQHLAIKKSKMVDLQSSVRTFNKGSCPTCGQKIDQHTIADWGADVDKVASEISALLSKRQTRLDALTKLKWKRNQADQTSRAANSKGIQRAAELQERIRTTAKVIKEKAEDRVALARRKCPHDTESIEESIERYTKQIKELTAWLNAGHERMAGLEFWNKAFRDIRLSLVQESITQFEAVSNSAAHALGLEDWVIEFGVESETKSGKLHRGFTIHIRSPYNTEPVPFLAWSGGESQRLALAIGMGFSDLIRDFSGVRSSIEIWDEASKGLSAGGVENVLQLLKDRSDQCKTTIFLIEHQMLEFGGFDRVITVKKTDRGSELS